VTGFEGLSCIVPAFNEAPRIGAVLGAVTGHPRVDEVIVVDDGSTDGTADLAEGIAGRVAGVRVIRQAENRGKTRAVAAGIAAARQSHLMLVDADLVGLDATHLSALIAPVAAGDAGASISLRKNAPWPWRALGIDYISGERVMPRAMLGDRLDALEALPRFGLEVFMNELWLDAGWPIAVVPWPDVASPLKAEKAGSWAAGLAADARMMRDIFRTVPVQATVRQVVAMRARRA
jgi:glycosyltransferase involved in cell wall biosynthesis